MDAAALGKLLYRLSLLTLELEALVVAVWSAQAALRINPLQL
jgi:hypothetical protein